MYKALYRKWRPLTFSDVYGQGHITTTLKNQLSSNRYSHAYLFTGTRGTGKTSCAKILARAVNCTNLQNGDPCNACPSCLGILDGSILDVIEIDAASNNGVDNIRDIREQSQYVPTNTKTRVYIIDEVHMLSMGAFNALLKTLEEPPAHVMFILATTEIHKVPATILSRCQRFDFKRISPDDIVERLRQIAKFENLNLTTDGARFIAKLADGAMRDALSILERCTESEITAENVATAVGILDKSSSIDLLDAILNSDMHKATSLLSEYYVAGKELSSVMDQLLALIRDILLVKLSKTDVSMMISPEYSIAEVTKLANEVTSSKLIYISNLISENSLRLSRSSNKKIDAELLIIRLCEISRDNHDTLTGRVEAIEEKLEKGIIAKPKETTKETSKPKEKTVEKKAEKVVKAPSESSKKMYSDLLSALKGKINRGSYTCMSISSTGFFEDNKLIIVADDDITANLIRNNDTRQIITETANELFSKSFVLDIKTEAEEDNNAEIDKLINKARNLNIEINQL